MASSTLMALLIVSVILFPLIQAQYQSSPLAPYPAPQSIDCDAACSVRCSKSSRPNLCIRACGSCCAKCHCVPPGTSGNYEACSCYANQTTRKMAPKCP